MLDGGANDAAAGTSKQRTTRVRSKVPACDRCFSVAKKKCDGALPSCGRCERLGAPCTYVRRFISPKLVSRPAAAGAKAREEKIARDKSTALKRRAEELEGQVKVLFQILAQQNGLPLPSQQRLLKEEVVDYLSSPLHSGIFSPEERLLSFAFPSFSMRESSLATSTPFTWLDWPKDDDVDNVSGPSSTTSGQEENQPLSIIDQIEAAFSSPAIDIDLENAVDEFTGSEVFNLPEQERDMLVNRYFEVIKHVNFVGVSMPIIHEKQFRSRLTSANPPAKCLVLGLCAIASISGQAKDGSRWPYFGYANAEEIARGDELFAAAAALISIDQPTLDTVQAIIFQTWYCMVIWNQRSSQGYIFSGMAIRMALLLKLDIDPDELNVAEWTWLDKEIRRRTFHMILYIDLADMLVRERCFGLWRKEVTVKMPEHNWLFQSADPVTGTPTEDMCRYQGLSEFQVSLTLAHRVAAIMDFIANHGSSLHPFAKDNVGAPPASLGDDAYDVEFERVATALARWKETIPDHLSFERVSNATDFTQMNDMLDSPLVPINAARLRTWYCTSKLRLHRSRLFRILGTPGPDMAKLFESFIACADAAETVLLMLASRIRIMPPSFLPTTGLVAVCDIAGNHEAPSVAEAGVFHMIQIILLDPSARYSVPESIRSSFLGILGETALPRARVALTVCLRTLEGIIQRRPMYAPVLDMLKRVIESSGIVM